MKKLLTSLSLALLLLGAGAASAQVDPKDQSPVVVHAGVASGTVVSSYYAVVLSAAGETVFFQVTGGTGSFLIEGTIDSEAAVAGNTATWTTVLPSSSTIPTFAWVTDPPAYLRVSVTRATGTIKVTMRGNGTTFRVVR